MKPMLLKPNSVKTNSIKKGLYRHFKGNYYQVLDVAGHSENQQLMVVYRALYGDKGTWVRPLSMFTEIIERDGVEQARFAWCDEQTQVWEVAILDIVSGRETDFEESFAEAAKVISSVEGYISHQLKRCVEHGNRYLLLVEWQAIEDHTVGFRESEQHQQWRELLHHFFQSSASVLHYQSGS